jgi:TRAP-type C4-dicarboxylate transport system permease small subunit
VKAARTALLIAAVLVFLCGSLLVLVWGSWEIATPFYSATVLLLGITSLVEGRNRRASWVVAMVGLLVTTWALIRLLLPSVPTSWS